MLKKEQVSHSDFLGEIDVLGLITTAWRRRKIVAITILSVFLIFIIYLHQVVYKYTVSVKFIPVEQNQQSSRELNNITHAFGVSLTNDPGKNSFDLYLEVLKSELVAQEFVRQPQLMHRIFASEWSEKENRWKDPSPVSRKIKGFILSVLGAPPPVWQPPSTTRVEDYLNNAITISVDKKSPVVTITMKTSNPMLGQEILTTLYEAADDILRERTLKRSTGYINYLNMLLQKATIYEYRMALIQTLAEQEKLRMASSSTLPFVAEPFGSAKASVRPTSPSPFTVLLLGLIVGLLLGVVVAIGYDKLTQKRLTAPSNKKER